MLSIITATYNRAALLPKLYASLLSQTEANFEWIVIDDGSIDNTDVLVNGWRREAKIKIIYEKQSNGGKHRAVNHGVRLANGAFCAIMDSDDIFFPDAVEAINKFTESVLSVKIIAGVMFSQSRVDKNGRIVKNARLEASGEYIDLYNYERNKKIYCGDRLEVIKTKLLRRYPFPEFNGEKFVTESAVWNKMSMDGYKFRICKKSVCLIKYHESGLTRNFEKLRLDNFEGYAYSIKILCAVSPVIHNFWVIRNYAIISRKKGLSCAVAAEKIGISSIVLAILRITGIK